MDPSEIYTPESGPPAPSPQIRLLFEKWGETNIRALVSVFYDLIAVSSIKEMFPKDLELAKEKQADFIIQVLGGPSLYVQKWGPARMRQRHFAFPISEKERIVWFDCYDKALESFSFEHEDKIDFFVLSRWI